MRWSVQRGTWATCILLFVGTGAAHAAAAKTSGCDVDFQKRGIGVDQLIKECTTYIQRNPRVPMGYLLRGVSYGAMRDFDRAVVDLTTAIGLNSKIPFLYEKRADVYKDKGEFDKAIADFTKAITLDSKNYRAYEGRGSIYYRKHDLVRAIADFGQAITIGMAKLETINAPATPPKDLTTSLVDSYIGRSIALREKGDPGAAIGDCAGALILSIADDDPDRGVNLHYECALTFNAAGRFDDAIKHYSLALRDNEESSTRKSLRPAKTGSIEAVVHAQQSLSTLFRNQDLYVGRALAYKANNNLEAAIKDLDTALGYDKDAKTYATRASFYEAKGDRQKAIDDYKAALSVDASHQPAKDGLKRLGVTQ